MTNLSIAKRLIPFFLFGGMIAALWIHATIAKQMPDGDLIVYPFIIPLLAAATLMCIGLRYLRWQFLIRQGKILVPSRRGLSIYLSSLIGIATPAYIGEIIRAPLAHKEFGIPKRTTILVLIMERLLDVSALAIITAATASSLKIFTLMMGLALLGWALIFWIVGIAHIFDLSGDVINGLKSIRTIIFGTLISLLAWLPASCLVTLSAQTFDTYVPLREGMHIFSLSTVLGGFTLMPMGVGATGSVAIVQLQGIGMPLPQSVVTTSLVRMASTGLSLAIGVLFLFGEWRKIKNKKKADACVHFDEIAPEYLNQFSPHIWSHLFKRKLDLICENIRQSHANEQIGLDVGCGLGTQCTAMMDRGYRMTGIDMSSKLLEVGIKKNAPLTLSASSVLSLPFLDNSFDFAYAIGVLHHLPDEKAQRNACDEITRTLKPGGRFLVHETNPRNILFRFYMGYLFPILRSIDEGTELWIEPEFWENIPGLKLLDIKYFTFLPDFLPRVFMKYFIPVERALERCHLNSYSVHYMAVLEKANSR